MVRDFRPKDKKSKAPRPSGESARPAVAKPARQAAPAASAAAPAAKKGGAESGNSSDVDDDTLMREIEAMGGSKEDLKLVKGAGKGKAKEAEAEDPTLDADVRSFMKQLNFGTAAPAPVAASPAKEKAPKDKDGKKIKESKSKDPAPAAEAPREEEAPKKAAAAAVEEAPKEKKKKDAKEKDKSKVKAAPEAAATKAAEEADWKAQREAKAAAVREAKASSVSATLATVAAKSKEAKASSGASKSERELVVPPAPHWSTTSLPALPAPAVAAAPTDKKSKKHKHKEPASLEFPSDERIQALHERGTALLEADNKRYTALASSGGSGGSLGTLSASDAKFIASLLGGGGAGTGAGGGTLSDRIAALTLLVQSSPLHNMHAMETLLTMAGKKNREESGRATRALGDWLASASGLGERKLRYFRDQPLLPTVAALVAAGADEASKPAINAHLTLFAFEDALKKFYFSYLQLLEAQSHDALPFVRKQATTQVYILLRDKSEQEQNLLRLLVNKLGDGERAVASKASSHLLELLATHPNMKSVIVREVAQLVLKPASAHVAPKDAPDGQASAAKHNSHARYYGVLTLNQTLLTTRDDDVAARLVSLYFELFEGVLRDSGNAAGGKEETIEDAERAAAEAAEAEGKPAPGGGKKEKNRWRDAKGKKGKKGGKAPEAKKAVVDADAKMMAAILTGMRRAFPFAKLETDALDKHMDTLFRITHTGTFNISIQALQLIFQVAVASSSTAADVATTSSGAGATASNIADRFYTTLYSSMLDSRLATTSKQAMYLNLLFKALKADDDERRSMACVKRLVQTTLGGEPPWICGALFLLGELFKARPSMRTMLTEPEEDGEEHFVDAPDEDEDEDASMAAPTAVLKPSAPRLANAAGSKATSYDARKRDPRWAGAELTCLWELVPLLFHFHPSVALHAGQLLEAKPVTTTADLSLNTLSHFLDRFVYRNPKKSQTSKGASIMQPAAAAAGPGGVGLEASVVKTKGMGVGEAEFVNSEKFWRKKAGDVPVDQLFFHQYFNQRLEREAANKKASKRPAGADSDAELASDDEEEEDEADSDDSIEIEGENDMESTDDEVPAADEAGDDSDTDSEGEKEIWEAMKRTMPREDGDDALLADDSDDDDLDEFDYVDSDDEAELKGGASDEDAEEQDGFIRLDADEEAEPAGEDIFDEDEDDLLPFHGFASGSEDEDAAAAPRGTKRAAAEDEEDDEEDKPKSKSQMRRAERKKRKALPDFASADDYAHLLGNDEDEDIA